jgi:hypothetical protein
MRPPQAAEFRKGIVEAGCAISSLAEARMQDIEELLEAMEEFLKK